MSDLIMAIIGVIICFHLHVIGAYIGDIRDILAMCGEEESEEE